MRLPLLLLLAATSSLGCYYAHLARGQARLLLARRANAEVQADPATAPEIVESLALVARVREFGRELGLRVDDQYTSYAPWPGDRVVTTVVATRFGEIEARPFHFPLVGAVPYKGFFDEARAKREAQHLRAEGLDVCVVPVRAYSTLGWFDDPLTEPMLRLERGELIEVVLHELVHATVFARDAPAFNEGLASFVGHEAAVRFRAREGEGERARREVEERRQLEALLERFRREVAELYAESHPPAVQAKRREILERDVRRAIAALPVTTFDARRHAREVRLNDACQALAGTYEGDLPRFRALLDALDGDLGALLRLAREASTREDPRAALFGPLEETVARSTP